MLRKLSCFEKTRKPWLAIAFICFALLTVSHLIFQNWLYMRPCEQCVYIRFAFLVMGIGALIASIRPKNVLFRLTGYVSGFFSIFYGTRASLTLIEVSRILHSDDPYAFFGIKGCSLLPKFPFGLRMHEYFPEWFLPTAQCGMDKPLVPRSAELSSLQSWFIGLYQDAGGWYLFPGGHFMSMAECTLLAFSVAALIYTVLALGFPNRENRF